jgi:tetratricopeptide (TPR) repeat protein
LLHPVIRSEAIARLRASEDWETANQKAAEFWTESVETVETVEDALRAFESYHHYVEIDDFEQAAGVILEVRNHNTSSEHLGYACWRLGLLKQVISSISRIKGKINDIYFLSTFNRILGYAYNLLGNVHKAIKYHEESARGAINYLNSMAIKSPIDTRYRQIRDMHLAYWVNIGVAKLDLWELTEARDAFSEAISLAESYKSYQYLIEGYFCLALVKSYLGFKEEAYNLVEKACSQMGSTKFDVSIWSRWTQGYYLLFLGKTQKNLGEIEKSLEMYHRAITYAKKSYYSQVRAKAIDGLAEIAREQGDFGTALSHHSEAIQILDKIGAKCDLAEACYQLGLTHQKMGDTQKSRENFDKAIQLFSEMKAPKQVEKVQRAIEREG